MNALTLRRWSYRLSAVLGAAYVLYVIVMKLSQSLTSGPLGGLGEFFLVLASVTLLSIGLFADEAAQRQNPG
ncbi:MAG: hypothetical protein ABIQ60_11855 [Burkholderiaceae bacterium]